MIRLDLPRAEEGGYRFDSDTMESFGAWPFNLRAPRQRAWLNVDQLNSGRFAFLPVAPAVKGGDNFVFLKYDSPSYFAGKHYLKMFGELLYSEVAKAHGFESVNIDLANFSGNMAVLSQAECAPEKYISYLSICGESLPAFCKHDIRSIVHNVEQYALERNLAVDDNLNDELLKMLLLDFLTFNPDRSAQNIAFIVDGGKIRLAKAFDNAESFLFSSSAPFLETDYDMDRPDIYYNSLLLSNAEGVKAAKIGLEQTKTFTKIFIPPRMTIKSMEGRESELRSLYDDESIDIQMTGSSNIPYMTLLAKDIALEMSKNAKLQELYMNIHADFSNFGDRIFEQTGFRIPDFYLEFANDIFQKQKRRLDYQLDLLEEKGKV